MERLREAEIVGRLTVVDAFARLGNFGQAEAIIAEMKAKGIEANEVIWMCLLGPCRRDGNITVAKRAFHELGKPILDKSHSISHCTESNNLKSQQRE